MEQRLVPGVEVEHAGRRWHVHRPLGPDAVLLRNDAGEIVSAAPARIGFPADEDVGRPATRVVDERGFSDAQWAEAARRRDLIAALAGRSARSRADVDAVAKELGIKRRRVWTLLRQTAGSDGDIAVFLPRRGTPRAKRLGASVETVIAQAIDQHYAQANRPSIARLHKEVTERCKIAGARSPSYRAVAARVRDRDQAWLVRRREGPKAACRVAENYRKSARSRGCCHLLSEFPRAMIPDIAAISGIRGGGIRQLGVIGVTPRPRGNFADLPGAAAQRRSSACQSSFRGGPTLLRRQQAPGCAH